MDKRNWYFKQAVGEADMDQAFNWVQTFIRSMLSDGQQPWGIASGYEPSPVNDELSVLITNGIAYDQVGRRIVVTAGTVTQSVATTSSGLSTAVVGDGNERWVSIFAKGGWEFTGAATDGSGNTVRSTMLEALNRLGEGVHGVGNYDPVQALEDGLNEYLVTMGDEAVIGLGLRPPLQSEAVLICDLRLTYNKTEFFPEDILLDRRHRLVPGWRRNELSELAVYSGEEGVYNHGIVKEPVIGTGALANGAFGISVIGGHGYLSDGTRWDFFDENHTVHMKPVFGSFSRQDLIVIDPGGSLRAIAGDPASPEPVPPAVPPLSLPLAEIRVLPSTTHTGTYPWVRRSFRRAPYPFATMTGILEGCRLEWPRTANTEPAGPPRVVSVRNKILFDGEIVEFPGGIHGANWLYALQDPNSNPFGVENGTGFHRPYYIYACRNQFWSDGVINSPVIILESMIVPNMDGRPSVNLTGSRGAIFPNDALLVGIGWTKLGTTNRVPVTVDNNGWHYMGVRQGLVWGPNGNVTLQGAPATDLVDMARIRFLYIPSPTLDSTIRVVGYDQLSNNGGNNPFFEFISKPSVEQGYNDSHTTETIISAPGGRTGFVSSHGNIAVETDAYHINLPRVGFGGV